MQCFMSTLISRVILIFTLWRNQRNYEIFLQEPKMYLYVWSTTVVLNHTTLSTTTSFMGWLLEKTLCGSSVWVQWSSSLVLILALLKWSKGTERGARKFIQQSLRDNHLWIGCWHRLWGFVNCFCGSGPRTATFEAWVKKSVQEVYKQNSCVTFV